MHDGITNIGCGLSARTLLAKPHSLLKERIMKVAVVGAGYVGLSNAVLLAQHHQVIVLDVAPEKVEMINGCHEQAHSGTQHI